MGFLSLKWGVPEKKASKPCKASIKSPTDELRGIDAEITRLLEKWDVFDVDVRRPRIKGFKKLVAARRLEWFDPELEYDDIVTFSVGKIGTDFVENEKRR